MTLLNAEDTHCDIDTTSVSEAYHDFLAEHGPDFAVPVLLHGAFHGTERLAGLLLEALRTVAASADGSVRLRAFDGFALDYRLTNTLATTPVGDYPERFFEVSRKFFPHLENREHLVFQVQQVADVDLLFRPGLNRNRHGASMGIRSEEIGEARKP